MSNLARFTTDARYDPLTRLWTCSHCGKSFKDNAQAVSARTTDAALAFLAVHRCCSNSPCSP
jgi:ribosomal protein L37AE/L43A